MIEDLATIEWRGVTLHRVADLEGYRRQWFELFDYHPVEACKWESTSGVAYVSHENGLWAASWGRASSAGFPKLEAALAACDAECRRRAAEHIKAAEVLLRGLESGTP